MRTVFKAAAFNRQSKTLETLKSQLNFMPNKNNLFRVLTGKEEEALSVIDNRNIWETLQHPNNDVLVLCDHASSDLKGFKLSKEEDENL